MKLRPPRFYSEILQAIYELREVGGSRVNKITNYVKRSLAKKSHHSASTLNPNISVQIRKALKDAVKDGVIRYRTGRYRIDTMRKHNNDKRRDPLKDCAACRREKRKRQQAKRRKTRRSKHRQATRRAVDDDDCYDSVSEDSWRSRSRSPRTEKKRKLPNTEAKRPRRGTRNRRGRKTGKIGKQVARSYTTNNHHQSTCNTADAGPSQPETFYMNHSFIYPDDLGQGDDDLPNAKRCDNPNCLCNNIKKEKTDSRENFKKFDDTDNET